MHGPETRLRRANAYSRVTAFAIVAAQIVTGCVLSAWLLMTDEGGAAYSVLLGTLVGALPGFCLAARIFNLDVDMDPERRLRAIYVAEAVKMTFAAALFVVVILALEVSVPYVLVGYLVTVLVNWFALLMPVRGPGR